MIHLAEIQSMDQQFEHTKLESPITIDPKTTRKESSKQKKLRHFRQIGIFIASTIGHISLGMALSWSNTLASDLPKNNSTLLGNQLHLLDWEMDMTSSIVFIGTVLGFCFGGWIVAHLGRRRSLTAAAIPGAISWVLIAISPNAPVILAGRFISGMSYALLGVAARSYLVEVSDVSIRGKASLMPELMKGVGQILVVAIGIFIPWYYIAIVCSCLLLLYGLVIVPLLPESPAHLVLKGKEEEVHKILCRLRGPDVNPKEEIRLLKEMNKQTIKSVKWTVVLKADVRRRFFVILGLFVISNFSGSEVLRGNALRMLQSSELSMDQDLNTILIFVVFLMGVIVQTFVIDRIGRRNCLKISLSLVMVAYAVLGSYVFLENPVIDIVSLVPDGNETSTIKNVSYNVTTTWSWIPLVCLLVAAFSMSFGAGTIPMMLSVEYFPTNMRSQVMSICNLTGGLLGFTTLQLYSPTQELLTPAGMYWSYSCFAALGIIYTHFIVVETKGRVIG